jgi:hypothetical protein
MKNNVFKTKEKQRPQSRLQAVKRQPAKAKKIAPWYKLCRPHLEWVNWNRQLDAEVYADELIDRAKSINSDTLVYPWESGGYLLYPGELADPYENLNGKDLFGLLVKKTQAAGLRFVVCFLGLSANTYLTQTRQEWVQRDKDGHAISKWHGYHFRSMCPNSPYGEYLYVVARDLLQRYPLDGIYIEGVYMGRGYCYCKHCRRVYKEMFSDEMPVEDLEENTQYNLFRQTSFTVPFQKIRRAIDDTRPEAVFFACIGYTYYFGTQGDSAQAVRDLADVVGIESQWNYDLPSGYDPSFAPTLQETGLIMQIMRAESKKPPLGTVWIGKHVDQNYAPRTPANVILNYQELINNGAIAQVHTQNALEIDPTLQPALQRLYTDAEKVMPYLSDASILTHTAILDWADVNCQQRFFDDSLRGAYKAMLEGHVPTRIVTKEDVKTQDNKDYDVLLLANTTKLDRNIVNAIVDDVRSGQGLVLTYQSILADEKLAELAGIRHKASVVRNPEEFPLHTYYRIDSDKLPWKELSGSLMSFSGAYEAITCQKGTTVIGHILDFDPSRMSEKHILHVCYPGPPKSPMLTVRQFGKGIVVYIAADLCAAARRYGDKNSLDVLNAAVRYAGQKDLPLKTNCPPCVEIVTHRKSNTLAVMLLNQTTNQYMADPIRYVVPIHDVEIQIKTDGWFRKIKKFRTVSGQKVEFDISEGQLSLRLPKLSEYESILIDF